jgi:hypothetical protein
VALALDEICDWGSESLQVRAALEALVEDLLTVAPGDRRPALERRMPPAKSISL